MSQQELKNLFDISGAVFIAGGELLSSTIESDGVTPVFGNDALPLIVRNVTNSNVSGIGILEGRIIDSTVRAVSLGELVSQLYSDSSIIGTTVIGSFNIAFGDVVSPLVGNFCYYDGELYNYVILESGRADCTLIED